MNRPAAPSPAFSARAGRIALAVGGLAYAAGVLATSAQPGARGWGLHSSGFLPFTLRLFVLAFFMGSAALLTLGALSREPDSRESAGRTPRSPGRPRRAFGRWLYALLLPYAGILWALRARTQLLGDGAVWLVTAESGEHRAYSEPLSAALWYGFGGILGFFKIPLDAASMSLFSVLCGLLAAPLLALIAREITSPGEGRVLAFALLLTLGVSQLYFGYVESYPAASLFILLYLWLALRRTRGADSRLLAAVALALAVAAHMSAFYLVPSYLLLLATEKKSLGRKLAESALPLAIAAAVLLALGYPPSKWAGPFRAATSGLREGFAGEILHRPYGLISTGHVADVANAVLLAVPVPALLVLGWIAATRGRLRPLPARLGLLGAAAVPGLLLAAGLMTPVAPAQDWDLASMFLLPLGVFGVAAGGRLFAGNPNRPDRLDRKISVGLLGISLSSLLAFVLVNANEPAAVARFGVVVNDGGRVSPYGRAYGNSTLEQHLRDRRRFAEALPFARAALAAEPSNPRYWTNVGNELMALDRIEEAIPFLEEGVRRGPERWQGKYNLGLCYMKLDRSAEAIGLFRDAVRLEGERPELRHNLGLALFRSGQADSAVVVWREILARWPEYAASLKLPAR